MTISEYSVYYDFMSTPEPISKEKINKLLLEYPNDERYIGVCPRAYLGDRMKILIERKITSNTKLSKLCGKHPTTIYGLHSIKAAEARRKDGFNPSMPTAEIAITLEAVTHGFISTRFLRPSVWESLQAIKQASS